jgi:hypothetical protein
MIGTERTDQKKFTVSEKNFFIKTHAFVCSGNFRLLTLDSVPENVQF